MFRQLLTPVGDSLGLSFLVAILPVVAVLVLLGLLRRPAWQAALAGLIVGLIVAVSAWHMPIGLALDSVLNGAVFALWPVMWIVVNALLLYNIAVRSGRFDAFRAWVIAHLPNDRRVVLVVVGFCFGALLEGIAGFGTPVAITSSLLILVGFPPLEALVFVLIFNTAPVAFGALGVPVTVLGAVTGLPASALGSMIGRQLPVMALILPFYVTALYGGWRSVRALWPVLLVAGGSFAITQFVSSNFIDYTLTDVLSSLGSLIVTLLFVQFWRPVPDPEFKIEARSAGGRASGIGRACLAGLASLGDRVGSRDPVDLIQGGRDRAAEHPVAWPAPSDLDHALQRQAVRRDLGLPAARHRNRDPGGGGHHRARRQAVAGSVLELRRTDRPSGLVGGRHRDADHRPCLPDELLGSCLYARPGAASTGHLFVLLSPFLGWVAVMLSGSDTSGNALFGNLQVVAARQLGLDPVLFAATNSSGGVMGKMISPQNIATGVSVTKMEGPGGRGVRTHLRAQHRADHAAWAAGRCAAVPDSGNHPKRGRHPLSRSTIRKTDHYPADHCDVVACPWARIGRPLGDARSHSTEIVTPPSGRPCSRPSESARPFQSPHCERSP